MIHLGLVCDLCVVEKRRVDYPPLFHIFQIIKRTLPQLAYCKPYIHFHTGVVFPAQYTVQVHFLQSFGFLTAPRDRTHQTIWEYYFLVYAPCIFNRKYYLLMFHKYGNPNIRSCGEYLIAFPIRFEKTFSTNILFPFMKADGSISRCICKSFLQSNPLFRSDRL